MECGVHGMWCVVRAGLDAVLDDDDHAHPAPAGGDRGRVGLCVLAARPRPPVPLALRPGAGDWGCDVTSDAVT
eukprot:3485083-Rhodomonas_salina.2